jgi:TrmH family RNA methyltransferase
MACKAHDVLLAAVVYPSIEEGIKDAGLVVGATRRKGKIRYPVLALEEAVPYIMRFALKNRVSILFGREDKGLKNSEASLCDMLLEIPSSREYGSFNISHAVLLVCHAIFSFQERPQRAITTAPRTEIEGMYEHLERALRRLGYADEGRGWLMEAIERSFRRLFGRTGLMQKEVNMLRGIFTQIEERT